MFSNLFWNSITFFRDCLSSSLFKKGVRSVLIEHWKRFKRVVFFQCTALQPYDRVKLSLHLVKPETILGFECNRHQNFGSNNPIVIETSIHNINGSHGDFSVYLSVLAPQSIYCLQIELLDHPYCNSHLTIGHGLGSVPRVCASHMAHPVITPKCTDSHGGQVSATN